MNPGPESPQEGAQLRLLAESLGGEFPARVAEAPMSDLLLLVTIARSHGVTPLLHARISRGGGGSWPEPLAAACREDALEASMQDLQQRAELRRVLPALAGAGVQTLLLKGVGLAYSHYGSPAHRPRADIDLLVPEAGHKAAAEVLWGLGYRRVSGPAGSYVGYQLELANEGPRGVHSVIDLHWRISSAQVFAWLLEFAELAEASVAVPELGSGARRLGDAHALMLALLHRAGANRFQGAGFGDRLIWLHDIHLLVEMASDADLDRFCRLVEAKKIVAIALQGLRRTEEAFGSSRVKALGDRLECSPIVRSGEAFLKAGKWSLEMQELRAMPGVAPRLAYLGNRLVPSATYMRERYPGMADRPLALLYLRRWTGGLVSTLASASR